MNEFRVEEWTVKESELLGEMKDRCLKGGQYIDEKAKEKFKMLCHLEDYCIQYYQLLDYINQLETSIASKDNELLQLKEELRQLKTNRDEVIEYAKGYFTKAIPFNPYVVIEKLERGKEDE